MDEAPEPPSDAGAYSYVVVALLAIVYALSFMDRQVLSVLAEPIRKELGLSDTEIGALGGVAFALFYTLCGIPAGWFADRARRVWIIAGACALWGAFTMACGTATSFAQLALMRVGVATGEAGGTAPSYSLISDYFPPRRRGTALALFSVGGPLGVMIGTAIGAWVAAEHGWRTAFVVVGAPGIVGALALLLFVREPQRGRMDPARPTEPAPSMGVAIRGFFADPVLRSVTFATTLSAFVAYAASAWTTPYLIRVKGMSLHDIALYYSLNVGAVGIFGTFASGWLVDRLAARDRRWYSRMPAIAFAVVAPFWLVMLWFPDWRVSLAGSMASALMFSFYLSPALAVVQNRAPARQRTISAAILLFVVNLFGLGGGPLLVGFASDLAKPAFGNQSLSVGLALLLPVMGLASLAHFRAATRYTADPDVGRGALKGNMV